MGGCLSVDERTIDVIRVFLVLFRAGLEVAPVQDVELQGSAGHGREAQCGWAAQCQKSTLWLRARGERWGAVGEQRCASGGIVMVVSWDY